MTPDKTALRAEVLEALISEYVGNQPGICVSCAVKAWKTVLRKIADDLEAIPHHPKS